MGNRVKLDEMGKRILDASRTELYLSMRFLGPALHSLGFIMDLSTTTVGTDAAYIRFNPNYMFRLYVDRFGIRRKEGIPDVTPFHSYPPLDPQLVASIAQKLIHPAAKHDRIHFS